MIPQCSWFKKKKTQVILLEGTSAGRLRAKSLAPRAYQARKEAQPNQTRMIKQPAAGSPLKLKRVLARLHAIFFMDCLKMMAFIF